MANRAGVVGDSGGADAGGAKRRGNPLVLVAAILGLIAVAAALTYVVSGPLFIRMRTGTPPNATASGPAGTAAGAGETDGAHRKIGTFVAFGEFIVNVAGTDGERYLKASVTVELEPGQSADEVAAKMPLLRDRVNDVLSSRTMAELEGTANRERLRRDLRDCVNASLSATRVAAVYLVEFVLQ